MVYILYTKINRSFQEQSFTTHLQTLPKNMQTKIKRYHRWQDQQATLLGKLLLRKGCEHLNITEDPIPMLTYTKYGRPSIPAGIDFNISHSGSYVVCAISTQLQLGIDIENIKPVTPSHFKTQMTPEEWNMITNAPDQTIAFYRYWTQKEAVIKADGKGLSIPLDSFMIIDEMTTIGSTLWHTMPLPIAVTHSCHLATPQKLKLKNVTLLSITL